MTGVQTFRLHRFVKSKLVCCDRFMVPEYRRPLIMQEILGYNADIICLQEVDEKAFATYFQPLMSYAGASMPCALLTKRRTQLSV